MADNTVKPSVIKTTKPNIYTVKKESKKQTVTQKTVPAKTFKDPVKSAAPTKTVKVTDKNIVKSNSVKVLNPQTDKTKINVVKPTVSKQTVVKPINSKVSNFKTVEKTDKSKSIGVKQNVSKVITPKTDKSKQVMPKQNNAKTILLQSKQKLEVLKPNNSKQIGGTPNLIKPLGIKVDEPNSKPIKKHILKIKHSTIESSKNESLNSEINKVKETNDEDQKAIKKSKFKIRNPFKGVNGENKAVKKSTKSDDVQMDTEENEYVKNLTQQAVALYTDNNLEDAIKTFLKIPEKYRSAGDYVLMGNILQDMQRLDDAIFMYKRAILIDETYYKSYYNLGTICLNEDKFFTSIDYFKQAIKYNPKFAYSYYNLGCAYIKTGQLKKAKAELNKAIELKGTEPDFHYNLAYVYKKLNKPKMAKVYLENYNRLTNSD